ncbi:hypothetical protein V1508DRAFT_433648 [Lipomyces doorenjongii]|uniref:uncharacterized protein n=1 Tax=Lipomyces doorenjongii TaxID=383834 RepID=UPI0034CF5AC0
MPDSQGGLSSPLEIESLPSSTGVEEISKAEEFRYLMNYQVLLDEVVFKKYALYTALDFNFSALVREIEADSKWSPSMQLAKTIAILQCSGRGTKATNLYLVECMIADGREYYDFERIIETWHSEKRSGIRVDLSLRYTKEISTRYQEELGTEPSYSDKISRSTGVASNPVQIMAVRSWPTSFSDISQISKRLEQVH